MTSVGLNLLYSDSSSYPISGIQIALLAAIVFLLLLISLSLWVLTRSVSRPLNLISRSVEAITAGDFE
ncbi:HAMP domain-containing protein [Acutalibacter sp. 1XD8-33]|nr:HAMP domain-containing protein [Acutalibacter sp. 1XD8-33]